MSGSATISVEIELAWGFHDNESLPQRLRTFDSRAYVGELIDILDTHGIPSTWATVGHLLLDGCERSDGRAHADLPAPTDNWYDSDPCSTLDSAPLWYAPDLVERLRQCAGPQEIGSHTFSHVTTAVSEDVLRAELRACRDLASEGEMESFVSPRHGAVPGALLADAGYVSYRAPDTEPPLRQAASFYTGIGHPETGLPVREGSGIWRHQTSTYFFYSPLNEVQRRVPVVKRRRFESGLQRAIERNEVFHVWAHPHNFIGDDRALDQFRWLVSRVAELRGDGRLDALTMRDLVARLEGQD